MTIRSENEVTGKWAAKLRISKGLSQKAFWGAICVSLNRGHAYESGRTKVIPGEVKRLLFLHYVMNLPTDLNKGQIDEIKARAGQNLIAEGEKLIQRGKEALGNE